MLSLKKDYTYQFKLVLIGDAAVGKSSTLVRFVDDTFSGSATVGVDFRFRTLLVDDKVIKLQIWDTAGQDRFKTVTSAYYRGANAIIMIYDVTNENSFNHVTDWLNDVNRYAPEDAVRLLVGNKCDMPNKTVSTEKAKEFADSLGMLHIEVSAKESTNVEGAFSLLARRLIEARAERLMKKNGSQKGESVTISSQSSSGSSSACCS